MIVEIVMKFQIVTQREFIIIALITIVTIALWAV
jgi:hypothetical protein